MRYISHELRTPLNIAFLGLKILFDDLVKLELPDLLQTVKDTQESCLVAVDILNDMLLYDHISSGVMILQKKSFDPIPFLIRAIKPFRTQVCVNKMSFLYSLITVIDSLYVFLTCLPGERGGSGIENAAEYSSRFAVSFAWRSAEARASHSKPAVQRSEVHGARRLCVCLYFHPANWRGMS